MMKSERIGLRAEPSTWISSSLVLTRTRLRVIIPVQTSSVRAMMTAATRLTNGRDWRMVSLL